MRRLNASFAALALALSLGLGACGDDDIEVGSDCVQDTPSGQLPTGGPVGCEDTERSEECIPRGNVSPSGETDNGGDAGHGGTTGEEDGATGDGEQGISGSAPGCEETDQRPGESEQTNLNTGNDGAVRGGSGQTTPGDDGGAADTCSGATEGVGECSGETTGEDAPEGQDHPETGSFRD